MTHQVAYRILLFDAVGRQSFVWSECHREYYKNVKFHNTETFKVRDYILAFYLLIANYRYDEI
jgi:hypothetical protein